METGFEPNRTLNHSHETPARPQAKEPNVPKDTPESLQEFGEDFLDLEKIIDESLGFSALTDGLGFHPKGRKIGEIRPSNLMTEEEFVAPLEEKPVAKASSSAETLGLAPGAILRPEPKTAESATFEQVMKQSKVTPTKMAAPWADRTRAFLFDAAFVAMPLLIAALITSGGSIRAMGSQAGLLLATFTMIFFGYRLTGESLGGQSLGKLLMGLTTVEDDSFRKPVGLAAALRRNFCLILGALPFGLGLLPRFADPNGRLWHDRLSATVVEQSSNRD